MLSSAARADLAHFSPGGGFDLGSSLSGLTDVLKRKESSATPGPHKPVYDEDGAPLAPQKQQPSQLHDGPPPPDEFDDMPEEPDWDEMAMMEAEAQSFAEMQEPPSDIVEAETAGPFDSGAAKRAAPASVEDSLFDDFDAPVVQSQPVTKRPRTEPKPSRQYVYRVEPPGGTVAVTNAAGVRVFVKTLARAGVPSPAVFDRGSENVRLTGESFAEMVREAEASLHTKQVEDAVAEDEGEADREDSAGSPAPVQKPLEDSLWVDRYRPSRFTELMSNAKANRNVLLWLTQWKNYIDGKRPEKRRQEVKRNVKFDRKERKGEDGGVQQRKPWEQDTLEDVDEDGRPACKLLLLAGPPGLGKTTMAHVLAQHAGFEVIEINASDERTAKGLRERVENATQMRSVLHGQPGHDAKPSTIILDEIDGAMEGRDGTGAITELLKLAAGEGRKAGSRRANNKDGEPEAGSDDEGEPSDKSGSKTKSSTPKLSRPIICICNDLWAPSLKALRDVARVFQFVATPPRTMAKRLTEICRKEGLEPDRGAIAQVVEIADGDIRSALNTLQFMQRKFGKISRDAITMAAVGHKDVGVTNFQLWRRIFGESVQAKARALSAGAGSAMTAAAQREELHQLKQMVESSSNMNQLLEGCHANCFTAASSWTTHDITMSKTAQLCDWLVFAETIRLERYAVPAVMAFHHTCKAAIGITPKISIPKAEREARLLQTSNVNVLDSFLVGVGLRSVTARRALSRATSAVETVPGLMNILRPLPLTTSGSHGGAVGRLNDIESNALRALVSVMHDYGLTYKQKFTSESGAALELQPPIHHLSGYTGMAVSTRRVTPRQRLRCT